MKNALIILAGGTGKRLNNPKKIPNPGEILATIRRNNIFRKFSNLCLNFNFMASVITTKKYINNIMI